MSETAKKLSPRARKFIRHYSKHGNATAAAKHAFNPKNDQSAAVIGHWAIRYFKIPLTEIMDAQGITDERLMEVLDDGLNASEMVIEKNGKEVTAVADAPDHKTRHRYLETGVKLKGHLTNTLKLELPPEVSIHVESKYVPAESESTG